MFWASPGITSSFGCLQTQPVLYVLVDCANFFFSFFQRSHTVKYLSPSFMYRWHNGQETHCWVSCCFSLSFSVKGQFEHLLCPGHLTTCFTCVFHWIAFVPNNQMLRMIIYMKMPITQHILAVQQVLVFFLFGLILLNRKMGELVGLFQRSANGGLWAGHLVLLFKIATLLR